MSRLIAAALAVTLCACGDDGGGADAAIPDAAILDAATFDAATTDAAIPASDAAVDAALPDGGTTFPTELDLLCAPEGPVVTALHKIFECGDLEPGTRLLEEDALSGERLETVCRNDIHGYLDDGTFTVDDDAIDSCLAWLETAPCELLTVDGLFPVFSGTPCDAVVVGTVALEDGCETSLQCAGDAYCKDTAEACGECTARLADDEPCTSDDECSSGACTQAGVCGAPGLPGDSCAGDDDCQGVLKCSPVTSECESPFPREGTPCTTQADCRADEDVPIFGLYCDVDGTGTCTPLPEPGEPCLTGIGPHETLCDSANYEWCSPVDGLCKEPLVSGEGEPCNIFAVDDTPAHRCGPGLACTSPFYTTPDGEPTGVCFTPSVVGESCGMELGDHCHYFLLSCLGGVCLPPDPSYTGTCPAGPCTPATSDVTAIGADCSSPLDCPAGYGCRAVSYGGTLTQSCEIPCTTDCECPASYVCRSHMDDFSEWTQCDRL